MLTASVASREEMMCDFWQVGHISEEICEKTLTDSVVGIYLIFVFCFLNEVQQLVAREQFWKIHGSRTRINEHK